MLAVIAIIVLSVVPQNKSGPVKHDIVSIPRGPAITLDGQISQGEWDHAMRVQLTITPEWIVSVLLQHDDRNLYLAFTNLRHNRAERYPEVLLAPANQKPLFWKEGQQWWLHASYNLCESNARPTQYDECAPTKAGWDATRFPRENGVSEIAISLDKVGLIPRKPFGMALDVTDTKSQWSFWPESAKLQVPMSWQTIELQK